MGTFNLEEKLANQEANENKVQADAVAKAKENMAQKKLEEEARKVERRLVDAEQEETKALKALRYDRKKADAQKTYLETISKAKEEFETSGDYAKYDKAVVEADNARNKALTEAKRAIYGDDYWRY